MGDEALFAAMTLPVVIGPVLEKVILYLDYFKVKLRMLLHYNAGCYFPSHTCQ